MMQIREPNTCKHVELSAFISFESDYLLNMFYSM